MMKLSERRAMRHVAGIVQRLDLNLRSGPSYTFMADGDDWPRVTDKSLALIRDLRPSWVLIQIGQTSDATNQDRLFVVGLTAQDVWRRTVLLAGAMRSAGATGVDDMLDGVKSDLEEQAGLVLEGGPT